MVLAGNFRAEGLLSFFGAEIGGFLQCSNRVRQLANPDQLALIASAAKIGGSVIFRDNFQANGEIELNDAKIGGLECSRVCRLRNLDGYALRAERATIALAILLRERFRAEGTLHLVDATIAGGLEIMNCMPVAKTGRPAETTFSLDLSGARFSGDLDMSGLRCAKDTRVCLEDTSCNALIHAKTVTSLAGKTQLRSAVWPGAGNLLLDGLVYRRISYPLTPGTQLGWLRRQLSPYAQREDESFRPQPYRQLAAVLRGQGRDAEARKVMVGMAKDRLHWAKLGIVSRIWGWISWFTIGSGYAPSRAGFGLLFLWLLGYLAFGLGYQMKVMVPSKRYAYESFVEGGLPGQYDLFCALVYSIDTSLPVIGFGQKDHWHPRVVSTRQMSEVADYLDRILCKPNFARSWDDPNSVWEMRTNLAASLQVYRWIHLALGWFFATMLVATISGLVGRK